MSRIALTVIAPYLVTLLIPAKALCADEVLVWNAIAAQTIVGPGGANKVPPLGLVDFAIVHTAVYDAVNAVSGSPHKQYAVQPIVNSPASPDAAPAAAAHDVLIASIPPRRGRSMRTTLPPSPRSQKVTPRPTGSRSANRRPPGFLPCAQTTAETRGRRSPSQRLRLESGSGRHRGSCRPKRHGRATSPPGS